MENDNAKTKGKNDNEIRSFRFFSFFSVKKNSKFEGRCEEGRVSREDLIASHGGRGGGRASQVRRVSGST